MRQEASFKVAGVVMASSLHVAVGWALWSFAMAEPASQAPAEGERSVMPIHLVSIETDADRALQPIVRQGSQSADRETPVPALTPAPSSQTAAAPSSGSRAPAAAAAADAPDRHVSLPDTEVAAYRQLLEAHLAQYRIYPPGARASHSEGVVVLHFVTDRDGRVSDAWVESSSGVSALDQEALLAVARAQPLPRFPSDWPAKIDFSLPLVFKLS